MDLLGGPEAVNARRCFFCRVPFFVAAAAAFVWQGVAGLLSLLGALGQLAADQVPLRIQPPGPADRPARPPSRPANLCIFSILFVGNAAAAAAAAGKQYITQQYLLWLYFAPRKMSLICHCPLFARSWSLFVF